MNTAQILLVEDDANIRQGLLDSLEAQGYQVESAADGQAGLDLFQADRWDLVILDIMMPGLSGYDLCKEIRRTDQTTPILFLTAKSEEIDKILGLELGADDYLTKPFSIRELHARIGAILRRMRAQAVAREETSALPDPFPFGRGKVSRKQLTFTPGDKGEACELTGRELAVLETFYRHPGEALSRDYLLNHVWGIDYIGTTRTLDQHIAQLRKKIEADSAKPAHILTVHGWGYRYRPAED